MIFKFVDNVIASIKVNLEILEKDTNNYTTLLFQHKGEFCTNNDKFGNSTDCSTKFSAFINLAKAENVSLALTPEYSCPWNSIRQIIQNDDKWPNQSKLWALSCESITPNEIKEFKKKCDGKDNILIYYDENAFNNGGGVLLDPLCYIFKANINNNEKLILLVQFKTQHSGVWETPLERDKYIWGNEVYILRNNTNSVYLFTNICSETAKFSITDKFQEQLESRWDENPYIILNPQMNPKPTHDIFKTFRKNIMSYPFKDIITLNWAGTTVISSKKKTIINLSKSSVFFKTSDVDFDTEERFINNHEKGLYYINKKADNHVYYFNPYEEVFLIFNQKPLSVGLHGAMFRRTGPEVHKIFQWSIKNEIWSEIDKTEDGFLEFLKDMACNNGILKNIKLNFILKERLVNLSCGKVSIKKNYGRWYRLDNLETFIQDEDEKVKRLTYVYDETSDDIRRTYIEYLECLNDRILPNDASFPINFSVFKGNCNEVMFFVDGEYNYNYNLVTKDLKHKATVAYIGRNNCGTAKKILHQMQELFEKGDQSKKRVIVWYKINSVDIDSVYDESFPKVDDDPTFDPKSITEI